VTQRGGLLFSGKGQEDVLGKKVQRKGFGIRNVKGKKGTQRVGGGGKRANFILKTHSLSEKLGGTVLESRNAERGIARKEV